MEYLGTLGMGLGSLLFVIGWIWLLVVSFKEGGVIWAIIVFFFSWIGGLIFCIVHKTAWVPLIMMIIGGVIAAGGIVPSLLANIDKMTP